MSEREDTAWPDLRRKLFEVSEHADRRLNACVGYVTDEPEERFVALVEGFRLAAGAIYERAVSSHQSPDYLVWPLVYVWRHQLEIALKELVALGRVMKGERWGYAPAERKGRKGRKGKLNHGLSDLWTEVREVIVRSGERPPADELDEVGRRVAEFEKMDPGSFGFRYTKDSSNSGRALSNPPEWINLGDFHEAMAEVGNFLKITRLVLRECHERKLKDQQE